MAAAAAAATQLVPSPSSQSRHRSHHSHHPSSSHHKHNGLAPSRSATNRQMTTLSPQPPAQELQPPKQQSLIPAIPQPFGASAVPQFVERDGSMQNADISTLPGVGDGDDGSMLGQNQLVHSIVSSTSRTRDGHIRIGMKWTLGQRIGAGNFGQVYIGHDIDGFLKYCIKMEKGDAKSPQLSREYRFYHMLRGHHGFPRVYWYGQVQKYNCLVMDLLGPSLDDLHGLCSRRFSLKTTCLIALQLIDRFEVLHSKGLIYRDVKPENFLLGRRTQSKENVVFVVDMGLAKLYRDARTGEHLPEAFGQAVTGTARYMSINANFGNEQSRRDDMEALGHLLIFFMRSRLPWQGLKPGNAVKDHIRLIGQVKRDTAVSELCEGLPEEFSLYISYCRHLDFYGKPDYEYLRELFIDLCERNGWKDDGNFDWTEREDEIMRHSQHSLPREPVRLGSQESHVGGRKSGGHGGHHGREKSKPDASKAADPSAAGPAGGNRKRSLPTSAKPGGEGGAPELPPTNSMSYMAPQKGGKQSGAAQGAGEKKAKTLKPELQQQVSAIIPGGAVTASKSTTSRSPAKARTSKHTSVGAHQRDTSHARDTDGSAHDMLETTLMPLQPPRTTLSSTMNKILNSKLSKKFSSVLPHSNAGGSAGGSSAHSSVESNSLAGAGTSREGSLNRTHPNHHPPNRRPPPRGGGMDNNIDDNTSIVFKFLCIRIRRKRQRDRF